MPGLAAEARACAPRRLRVPSKLTGELRDVYLRIPADIRCVPHESFDDPAAADQLFGPNAVRVPVPEWLHPPEVPDERSERRIKPIRLSPEQEVLLFLRYNYARWRLKRLIDAQKRRCCLSRAKEMAAWYRRVQAFCSDLVKANMALVLAMAKRASVPYADFGELCSEGGMALLRCIDKFDLRRGYKFSTYACRAIFKSFRRLAERNGRYRQRFPVEFDVDLQRSDHAETRHRQRWEDSLQALQQILSCNLAAMTDLERRIVALRFGLFGGGRKTTLAEIGRQVGFSNERVRQVLRGSLRKLRDSLQKSYLTG